jgi:hypothetical protein
MARSCCGGAVGLVAVTVAITLIVGPTDALMLTASKTATA